MGKLSKELQYDTWYHIAISFAVLLKLLFLGCAVMVFYEGEINNTDTPFFRKVVRLKDICNQCSIIVMCGLMIYLFNPRNRNIYIDTHMQTLLFAFAIIILLESHWVVFLREQSPFISMVQFFIGRTGTFKQQNTADKVHISESR